MRPRIHHLLSVRIAAFFTGVDLDSNAPVNGKGGRLRGIVSRLAHSPVFGMDIVEGHWWANTTHGWYPVSWYIAEAYKKGGAL